MSISDQIQKIRFKFKSDLKALSSKNGELDELRIKYLGRKGLVATLFNQMGSVRKDERPQMGKDLNKLKIEITDEVDIFESSIKDSDKEENNLDLTLPGDPLGIGSLHPLSHFLVISLKSIRSSAGASVVRFWQSAALPWDHQFPINK